MRDSKKGRPAVASEEGSTIRVVSARTGIPMETLRAWERRYGFPRPVRRTGSNRRLYSDADIGRLEAIQRALEGGYRIGDVIGKDADELRRLAGGAAVAGTAVDVPASSAVSVPGLVELLARDRLPELESQLRSTATLLGPRKFATTIAQPFAVAVGEAWERGELSVRHEHLATECLVTQIRQQLATFQDIAARPLVLLATLPGELHTLPLQMVALYLVAIGAKPRLLGGSTPPLEIAESARVLGVDAVGITIAPTADRAVTRADVAVLRKALPADVPLWLGGGGASAMALSRKGIVVVPSWEAIEAVVDDCRSAMRTNGSGR